MLIEPFAGEEEVAANVVVVNEKLYAIVSESPRLECTPVVTTPMYVVFDANPLTGVHVNVLELSERLNSRGTEGVRNTDDRIVEESSMSEKFNRIVGLREILKEPSEGFVEFT